MKRFILIFFSFLISQYLYSDITLLDGFEDTKYNISTSLGDRIEIKNSTDKSQGGSSVYITYSYNTANVWEKDASIEKTFQIPIDMRQMEYVTIDFNIPESSGNFILSVNLTDEKGISSRFLDYGIFSIPAKNWRTRAYKLSDLQKSRWISEGNAINLKKIKKIEYHIMNNNNISTPGEITFGMDNALFHRNLGLLKEVSIDNFESYTDNTALGDKWFSDYKKNINLSLEKEHPYAGKQSLILNAEIEGRWLNYIAGYTFATPQNYNDVRYFRIAFCGNLKLSKYVPTASIFLEDASGNRVIGSFKPWSSESDWQEIFLPFRDNGIDYYTDDKWTLFYSGCSCWKEDRWDERRWNERTNLSNITKIFLVIQTGDEGVYPIKDSPVIFDNLAAGYDTSNWSGYNVSSAAPENQSSQLDITAPKATWYRSNAEVLQNSLKENKPIVVYFRRNSYKKCEDFENSCLLSDRFNQAASGYTCMFEDLTQTNILVKQFSVFRVPDIIIINRQGNQVARFSNDIDLESFYAALKSGR